MKFLSDILAKAGLTVDGVVTLNNTATGQTPATNDNSTKLATTAFIKNQSYLSANQTITVSGDATGSGTTSIILTLANSGVTAGVYGNASNIPTITVDAKGRITSISTNAVSIITTLAGLSDVTLTSPSANQVLQYDGTKWVNGAAPTTYTLPIATSSILGGIKVGTGLSIDATTGVLSASGGSGGSFNFRTIQEFTATSGQTTFTISGGYVVGYVEVLINGVYLSESLYTATNGSTIVLDDAATTDDIVTVFLYSIYNFGGNIYARNVDTLTATAGQTSFTTSYIPGQIDVYYNGSKLTAAEYTATSGTAIVLGQAAVSGDIVEVVTYLAGAGINASRTLTINGTTYDLTANRTWTLTTANISEVTNLYYTDARARAAISVTGSGSYNSSTGVITVTGGVTSVNTLTGAVTLTTTNIAEGTNLYYTDARVSTYLTTNSYATQTYVGTQIANLVASAPATLDTLNELASALGNDPSFATTVATSIGTKVPQTRTITINGTAYDLSADRSWTIASGVTSFNTRTGAITAASGDYTTAQVIESGNLYYTDTRVRAAISLTTTGTSGAATYDSATGIFNIPQYQGGVTSFNTRTGAITLSSLDVTTALTYTPVTNARTLTINGTTYDLTADRNWSIDNASLGAQAALNGTGLVRMAGTTVSYDNATYATQSYVTTAVANLVNSAPSTLDTLNELATALGNDANFATTITTSIGTKQAQLNGTGFVKISGTTISYDNSTYLTSASLTSYVPYTGATADVVLGNNNLKSKNTFAEGDGLYNGGGLRIKQYAFQTDGIDGYNTISSQTSGFAFSSSRGSGVFNNFILDPTSLPNNTQRSYILPNANGTLALTTDLSSYLPLVGGTLSGALNGTDANFSSKVLIGAVTGTDSQAKLELISSGGPVGLKIKSSGVNGNNTFLSIESSKEWRFVTNRGDLISGNQGDLIIRNNTDGINHIILNQSGATTFYGALTGTTATFSGGGNTLVLKKGTGSPAIALAGTSEEATGLIEGVSGGGIKFYTSTGTLSSPSWSSKLLITPTEGVKFGANAVSIIGTEGANGYHYIYAGGAPKIYLEAAGVVAFLNTGGTFVGTTTRWNNENFGVQTSNSAGWSTIPSIMRLTNYISGGVTKITFTDSSIIDGWFGMVPISGGSYFAMGFSGYTEQGFKLYQNGSASISAASIGYANTKLQVNGNSTTDENAGTVFIQHSFSGTNGFGLAISRNGSSAAALSLGADSSNNGIISANNTNLRLGKNQSGTFYEYLNINTNGNSVFSGSVLPVSDATYNLGSTSFRWNNVYTTDLHLSNEGKQNIVDGTWGDWTLQEGENDIFMLNNRSGEKFKIKLEKI